MTRWTMRIVTVVALCYTALHAAASGVRQALDHPNLAKFEEQASPLQRHLASGEPVHTVHPAQYGPVFFFIMQPLLRDTPSAEVLARRLYILQLLCIAGSFILTCASLRIAGPPFSPQQWTLLVVWLAMVWLNFAPLYTILALKSVETWELFFVTLALYAYLRRWFLVAAAAIAAAGFIKVLPFAFVYYWLITDRKPFLYASGVAVLILLASQMIYGPEMGFEYVPRIVAGSFGSSYGLDWHENISLKAALARAFGFLPHPTTDAARTSGYFVSLEGWRRTAATVLGDIAVLGSIAALTWSWLRQRTRPPARILSEWSLLAVAVLILSPNTIFEYTTLALGAVSYALTAAVGTWRRSRTPIALLVASLFLLGGIVPRQVLNRLTLVNRLNAWTGHTHLMPSEAYQYYGFPLVGLVLLATAIVAVRLPDSPGAKEDPAYRKRTQPTSPADPASPESA